MEQRGVLVSWNDDKGFGFIQPEAGDERLFVHISAVRGGARPVAGDQVYYVAGKDAQGRLRAEHMRGEALSVDRPAIRRKPRAARVAPARPASVRRKPVRPAAQASAGVRNAGLKLVVLALLCLLPLLGSLDLWREYEVIWALAAYVLGSLLCGVLYASDKGNAQRGGWRTPEKTLHAVELLGGWPGALVAQQLLRHKTRKASYQGVFWLIVLAHQIFWVDWLLLDGRHLGEMVRPLLVGGL